MPPNAKQKAAIIEVIEQDADIRMAYCDPETGKTCAIGGLAKAAGWEFDQHFIHLSNVEQITSNSPPITALRNHIKKHYGLTKVQQARIQRLNDITFNHDERRTTIIEYVKSI